MSLAQHPLESIIVLSLVELCYRLERIDPHLVLSPLMFKREPKMLGVSVQFHLEFLAVDKPMRARLRELMTKHLLKIGAADALANAQ